MVRQIITVPRHLVLTDNTDWDIDWRNQSAREANGGMSVAVISAFPRWAGSPALNLHGSNIGLWRAIRLKARGRSGLYRVPMQDPRILSICADFGIVKEWYQYGIPNDEGYRNSEGYGALFDPFATVTVAGELGGTNIQVDTGTGPAPQQGQIMSYDDRPFSVVSARLISGTVYNLDVEMPFRSSIPVGAAVQHLGRGIFETTDADAGNPAYEWNRPSRPRLSLQEYLNR